MKKIMIAALAVAFAAIAQAATVNWVAQKGYLYDGNGTDSAKITSGTAYLMIVTSTFGQSDLVSAFAAAEGNATKTLEAMSGSGAMAAGAADIAATARIPEGVSTYNLTGDASAYFVVFANDKMYVSDTALMEYDPVGQEATGAFASLTTSSKLSFDAADGFSAHGAGWYNVPEPTSGLLLLLGMAGLALKRKQA